MEYIHLKNTDLTVSRLCMGGCPMGMYDWGETREEDFIEAIHTGLDLGINFFDTADTYGLGKSERILSKGLGKHRNDVVIQSKFGVRAGHGETVIDNSPAYIREALENTLRRLDSDYVDIYVIHYWDQKTPPAEIIDELERQKKAGKIRYFGLSNIPLTKKGQWLPFKGRFATAQYEFSLGCRDNEDALKAAETEFNATPMTWGSLGQGIFTGKYNSDVQFSDNDRRRRNVYINFHGEKLQRNLHIVENLREIAAAHHKTCSAAALRFILDYLGDSVVIAGVKNMHQMIDNISSLGWHLTETEISFLNDLSLNNNN